MILKLKSPFRIEEEREGRSKNNPTHNAITSSVVVGLRIITQISQGKSNVVVKSALKIIPPIPISRRLNHGRATSPADHQSCFLKSCHLCSKNLSLDKNVYMYRGDQGFCSIECRERQIVVDEMKELERSTKQMLASYRDCSNSGRRETRKLLEDLRRRNKSPHHRHHHRNENHWAIVS